MRTIYDKNYEIMPKVFHIYIADTERNVAIVQKAFVIRTTINSVDADTQGDVNHEDDNGCEPRDQFTVDCLDIPGPNYIAMYAVVHEESTVEFILEFLVKFIEDPIFTLKSFPAYIHERCFDDPNDPRLIQLLNDIVKEYINEFSAFSKKYTDTGLELVCHQEDSLRFNILPIESSNQFHRFSFRAYDHYL